MNLAASRTSGMFITSEYSRSYTMDWAIAMVSTVGFEYTGSYWFGYGKNVRYYFKRTAFGFRKSGSHRRKIKIRFELSNLGKAQKDPSFVCGRRQAGDLRMLLLRLFRLRGRRFARPLLRSADINLKRRYYTAMILHTKSS